MSMTTNEITSTDRCTCVHDDGVQTPGENPLCPVDGWDEPIELDMDLIAENVRRVGIPCVIEQTGGGTATLFAGLERTLPEEPDYPRYQAVAGPGLFRNHGPERGQYIDAWAYSEEFSVGFDDGGLTDPVEIDAWNEARIAEIIVAIVQKAV